MALLQLKLKGKIHKGVSGYVANYQCRVTMEYPASFESSVTT